jgi:hypothetical protein
MATNEHIKEFLDYYCDFKAPPQYAVLLKGAWGCGKTWFIKEFEKNFKENHPTDSPNFLYLSLYGIQSLRDIDSELFCLLHPVLTSKPVAYLYRFARSALKTTIHVDIDDDGKSDGSVSAGIPTERLIEKLSLNPSHILIVDDLERCSLPVATVLGYLNYFVEHGGVKAIVIANESELFNLDDKKTDEKNNPYALIKEKLIGRSFEIAPDTPSALRHFCKDLPDGTAKKIIENQYDLIEKIYDCSSYKNLRLVRHGLWEFERLSRTIDVIALASDPLMVHVLSLFLMYFIEITSGTLKADELPNLQEEHAYYLHKISSKNEPNPYQKYRDVREKYASLSLDFSLVDAKLWQSIFQSGSIPREPLNESLLRSKYFFNNHQPNWIKLWHGKNFSDDEFADILSAVESEWHSRSFDKLPEVIHVTGMFLHYAKHGIYNKQSDEIIQSAQDYVRQLIANGKIPLRPPNGTPPFGWEAASGLGFYSRDDPKFIEFRKFVSQETTKAFEADLPDQASKLLELVGADTLLFTQRLILSNHAENLYYKIPILHLLEVYSFVDKLLTASLDDKQIISEMLKQRYCFQEFNTFLVEELPWLKQVAEKLGAEVDTRAGKISSLTIKDCLAAIEEAISNLEPKS